MPLQTIVECESYGGGICLVVVDKQNCNLVANRPVTPTVFGRLRLTANIKHLQHRLRNDVTGETNATPEVDASRQSQRCTDDF